MINARKKDDLEAFGQEVSRARRAFGYNQDSLAFEALGHKQGAGFISRIEGGKNNLDLSTVQKLAEFLKISRDSIPTSLHWPLSYSRSRHIDEALWSVQNIQEKYYWYDLELDAKNGWMSAHDDIEVVLKAAREDRTLISDQEYYRLAAILLETSWAHKYPIVQNAKAKRYYDFIKDEKPNLETEVLRHLYLHNTIERSNYEVRFALRQKPFSWDESTNFDFHAEQCQEALQVLSSASENVDGWAESIEDMVSYQLTNVIKTMIFKPGFVKGKLLDFFLDWQRDVSLGRDAFSKDLLATELALVALSGTNEEIRDLLLAFKSQLSPLAGNENRLILYAVDLNLLALGEYDPSCEGFQAFSQMSVAMKVRFLQINRAYILPQSLSLIIDNARNEDWFSAAEIVGYLSRERGAGLDW